LLLLAVLLLLLLMRLPAGSRLLWVSCGAGWVCAVAAITPSRCRCSLVLSRLLQHQLTVRAIAVVACCIAVELLLYHHQVARQVCPAGASAGAGRRGSLVSAVLAACMLGSSRVLLLLLHAVDMRQRGTGVALMAWLLLCVLMTGSSSLMLL
jgi:hypothetical protein